MRRDWFTDWLDMMLLAWILIWVLALSGCGIKQTRPDGMYPKTDKPWEGRRVPSIGLNQLRCFGGGIGGCSLGGRAQ